MGRLHCAEGCKYRRKSADSTGKINTSFVNLKLGLGNTQDPEMEISDSESSCSNGSPSKIGLFGDTGLVKLDEEENVYKLVKGAFLSGLGLLGKHTDVVAIHKNFFLGLSEQARFQSFRIFSEAATKKCPSNGGNIRCGWYGTSKDGVNRIINHGFTHCGRPENSGLYGFGIYLSPHNSVIDSAMSSTTDEDGLRHMVLCRVILGNMEEVHPGSDQFQPSSKIFDSGVDNLMSPKKYIVWSSNMNAHILPEYVISFKAPPSSRGIQEHTIGPKSAWVAFPTLISILSRFLPPNSVNLVRKYHREFQQKKLSRYHLIQHTRQIVGDKLLTSVIKSLKAKQLNATIDSLPISHGGLQRTNSICSTDSLPISHDGLQTTNSICSTIETRD